MVAGSASVLLLMCLALAGQHTSHGRWGVGVRVARASFLEDKLPLKLMIATPVDLVRGGDKPVQLLGRQAITTVFSRPVIALGSDFGQADNFGSKVPFNLSCKSAPVPPGKFRWVTTTIARFDPDADWPTDLDCTFTLNKALTAYDGSVLKVSGPTTYKLVSQPQDMFLGSVVSERANNITGGLWDAHTGMPDDLLPEVPADGVVTLNFLYPVNTSLVTKALQLEPKGGPAFKLTKCVTPAYWLDPVQQDAATQPAQDESCVAVTFSGPLKDETRYRLVLPAGSRYSPVTGPSLKALSVNLAGLRAFRLPIRQDFQKLGPGDTEIWDGTSWRRLSLWLPHGLDPSVTATQLAEQISLCRVTSSDCVKVPITSAKLVGLAKLQLQVDGLQPRQQYSMTVTAADSIKDGLGKTLKGSSGKWWSTPLQPYLVGPSTRSSVATFSPSSLPSSWPLVTLGADGQTRRMSAWSLDVTDEKGATRLVKVITQDLLVSDELGTPNAEVDRGDESLAKQLSLKLDTTKDAHVIAACCTPYYRTQRNVSTNKQLVLRSTLLVTWVMSQGKQVIVWVTSTDATYPGPVAGATAYIYGLSYDQTLESRLLGSCVTGASGSCTVPMPPPTTYTSLIGVVLGKAGSKQGVTYSNDVGQWYPGDTQDYSGVLALDRSLVRPGDTLHVTGYVGQKRVSKGSDGWPVGAPNATTAVLVIAPGWDGGQSTSVSVPLSAEFGSLHSKVKVPTSSKVGSYTINLYVAPVTPPKTKGRRLTAAAGQGMASHSTRRLSQDFPISIGKISGNSFTPSGTSNLNNMVLVTSDSLVVSDPRPPTADLTVTAPVWSPPGSTVKVSLQATSYLGSQVAGAPINVVWNTPKASGLIVAITGKDGAASVNIPLGSLPALNASTAGDTLSVEASWVGPTRERIVRSASVKLQDTARRLELSRTLDTQLPGLTWGVVADVRSNVDESLIKGVKVSVTLKPNVTAGASCTKTSSCTVTSGDAKSLAGCQLSLPCPGSFILEACTTDSPKACDSLTLGLNASQWAAMPLNSFDEPWLTTDSTEKLKIGSTASLNFQNPWSPEVSALVLWGNKEGELSSKLFGSIPIGAVSLSIKLGTECVGGCSAIVLLSVPGSPGTKAPAGVSVSKLFDISGPHAHVLGPISLEIVQPSQLDVSVAVVGPSTLDGSKVALVAPGGNASITATVTKAGKPVEGAEVTLVAVDKAMLDLVPYPLRELASSLAFNLAAQLSATDADGGLVAPGALDAVFTTVMRRLGLDPWLPADTTVQPQSNIIYDGVRGRLLPMPPSGFDIAAVDQNDTAYLDRYTSPITYGLGGGYGCRNCFFDRGFPSFAMPSNMASPPTSFVPNPVSIPTAAKPRPGRDQESSNKDSTSGSGSSSSSSSSPRVASKFVSTPMFVVRKTNSKGLGSATFDAPMNLGTFIVRAYAVASGLSAVGAGESKLVVRRTVSLTASLPRIVRSGDNFLAGVLVTSPGLSSNAPSFDVTVELKLVLSKGQSASVLKLVSQSSTAVATLSGAVNQVEVRFNLSAIALGTASLQFTATDKEGASDSLLTTVPVLPIQSAVFVATSFALRPTPASGNATEWQEGLQLPQAVKGSGGLSLLAGVGYLPSIILSTTAVAVQRTTVRPSDPLDASTSLCLSVVPPVLQAYQQQLNTAQQGNATDGLAALNKLTDQQFGLLPYPPGQWGWEPTRADIILNAQAAYLFSGLTYPGTSALNKAWEGVAGARVTQWKVAAARQMVVDATQSRNPPFGGKPQPYQDWFTLAWVRLVLGREWALPACSSMNGPMELDGVCSPDENVRSDLSLAPLLAASPKAGLTVQLLTALALKATSNTKYSAFITKAADTLITSFRVTARTAYVAASQGSPSAAPLETQALALRLLVALNRPDDKPLVQKLASYLAAAGATDKGAFSSILPPFTQSPWVTAISATTLSVYDQAAGSTQPDLSIRAAVGKSVVLKATFNSSTQGQPPVRSYTRWERLRSNTLQFSVEGKGEVSVSAGLSFVPLKPLEFPSYRGIWVSSIVQATDPLTGLATGPPLQQAPLTSLLTVTIQVTTPDDLGAVTLVALAAGGLEPLDPLTTAGAGTGSSCPLAFWAGDAFSSYFWFWWWPICPAQEVRPSGVTWRWQRLMAGTHTLTYSAVAATQGAFQLPPVKASADDQPEVMGMTASGLFTVGASDGTAVPVAAAALPKSCPKDCSGNGACNTISGACLCLAGWTGTACDTQAS